LTRKIKRSVCPYDCPDACGLLIEVVDGKAIKVTGDPDHPFTRGTLCLKMNRYQDTVHSPLRLTRPLLRTGEKGAGRFHPISWEEAIDRTIEGWQKIIDQYGSEAILPYSYAGTMGLIQRNAGHPFFYRLGASRLDRTICSPAKDVGWKVVMGETPAPHPDEAPLPFQCRFQLDIFSCGIVQVLARYPQFKILHHHLICFFLIVNLNKLDIVYQN